MAKAKPQARRDGEIKDVPISFLAQYANGVRSAKSVLATFYGSTNIDFYAQNAWKAVEKSLQIFAEADPDEEWGRIQWGDHPWQAVEVKDKWEFLDKYIKPIIEQGRPIIHQYDEITQQTFARCDQQVKEIAAAQAEGRPEGSTTGPSEEVVAESEQVVILRAQGMTQKEVAKEIGKSQQRVSQLEKLNIDTKNKRDNIPIKTSTIPTPPNHRGTSKTHTIARLKRDGHKDLAQQVESGQLPAAVARRQAGYPGADRKVFSVGTKTNPQDFALRLADELPREFLTELTAALNELVLRGGS